MSLPVAPLASPDEDRAELGRLLASERPRLAERPRIVLALRGAFGWRQHGVAAELGLDRSAGAAFRH
jgi:hypothetical protein